MVLAVGQFRVSKYASSALGGEGSVGIPGVGGGMPGMPDAGGNFNLVPGNTYPTVIGPGGEIMPGGGSPFLPGGVPMLPAYSGPGGPMWDLASNGFDQGIHEMPGRSGQKLFGSRLINVNLPKMISAGQAFVIIVTYAHDERGEAFGTYKIKVTLPVLNIVETTQEKRVGVGAQDSVPINLTAPMPLPLAPVTGTVELIQTEGNDVTIDSEVITIPTEAVPNPPQPNPPPDQMPPIPPSEPPTMPPPPPVPLPPILQNVTLTITRGEDEGFQAIIIEAVGLESLEPTTVFVYLSQREHGNRGGQGRHLGWDKDRIPTGQYQHNRQYTGDHQRNEQNQTQVVSQATPAGSVAISSNVAHAYPTVSIGGITANGSGLRTSAIPNMPSITSIQALVNSRLRERLGVQAPGTTNTMIQRTARSLPEAQQLSAQIESQVQQMIAKITNDLAAQGVSAGPGMATAGGSMASSGPGGAVAVAGGVPILPGIPLPPKIYKRQRVSITASPEGTIRHVVRIREATPATPLFGYVVIFGHRSHKHSGRKSFRL